MSAAVFQSNHQYAKWAGGLRIPSNAILDKRQSQPCLRKDGLSPSVIQNNLPGFDGRKTDHAWVATTSADNARH